MLVGLYSAAAGMAAQQERMEALAGDLANVNTTGYKRLRVGFRDLVYQHAGRGGLAGVTTGTGAAATLVGRSAVQGALRRTDQPLDVALVGPGWFRVTGAGGERLTRDGSFHLNENGDLVTSSGHFTGVRVPRDADLNHLRVAPDGRVSYRGRGLGRLSIVTVRSPDGLASAGDNLFRTTAASGPAIAPGAGTFRVEQGALEGSNVDLADAMVDMMDAQRSFQLASKAIQMQDQMMEIANGVKR